MSIWRYADYWTDTPPPAHAQLTLGEGQTPLLRHIGPSVGLERLYFKLESTNPSGSFKDRFAAAAVADMLAQGMRTCLATSSGNTGAALSAYCAAAGIGCYVAVIDGLPRNKLRQMLAYGAHVFSIRQFGLDPAVTAAVLERLQHLAAKRNAALQVSAYCYSSPGMIGVESIAYELAEQLPEQIDHVFFPAGGGGLVLAAAYGFANLRARKLSSKVVAVECVQPEGNDTMAGPLARGEPRARPATSTTKISGLQVATVNDGHSVVQACRACGGTGHLVRDDEVYAAQARLAREEGIFTEPAGATALAGALKAHAAGDLRGNATVVCCVTGIGFKDEASVDQIVAQQEVPCLDNPADIDRLLAS